MPALKVMQLRWLLIRPFDKRNFEGLSFRIIILCLNFQINAQAEEIYLKNGID